MIWRRRQDEELDEEIRAHLAMAVRDRVERGENIDDAQRAVRQEFGNVTLVKETTREMWGWTWLERIVQDVRYGVRRLRRAPGFASAAIVMVALGVSVNTMMFSQLYALMLRPLPYERSDRLVMIGVASGGVAGAPEWLGAVSAPEYQDIAAGNTSLSEIGAHARLVFNLSGGLAEPQQVSGTAATSSFLSIFRVKPLLGRTFTAADEASGADRVAIISHRLWRQAFGADPAIVNRQITLNQATYAVIGVTAPESAPYDGIVRSPADLWVPLVFTAEQRADRSSRSVVVVGRLKDGTTRQQAAADVRRLSHQLSQDHPATNTGVTFNVERLRDALLGSDAAVAVMLQGAVLFVLLVACVNIANLLLARGVVRTQEIGVRLALGASRMRIVRQLVTENLILFLAGGLLALPIAEYTNRWFLDRVPFPIPELIKLELNWYVFAFTLALSILAGIGSAALPAILIAGRDVNDCLKDGGRGTTHASRSRRMSSMLVGAEIAFALVLLMGTGLLLRSLLLLQRMDPGFRTENLLTVEISLPPARYTTPDRSAGFVREATSRIERLPGVAGAAWTTRPPLNWGDQDVEIAIDGRPPDREHKPTAQFRVVTANYLAVLGVPLLAGRAFDARDVREAPPVVLVNETMAKRFWANGSPLGDRIRRGNADAPQPWSTIVGIVADVRHATLSAPAVPEVYVPFSQSPQSSLFLALRTAGAPSGVVHPLKLAIWSIDAELPASNVRTMDGAIEMDLWPQRSIATAFGLFSSLALLLAAVGTFAVVSYLAAQRTHEIGVRVAFGASRGAILRLLFQQAVVPVSVGLFAGTVLAVALGGVLRDLLFGVTRFDPPTLAAVLAVLVACSAIAIYLPARRAASADPMAALRLE